MSIIPPETRLRRAIATAATAAGVAITILRSDATRWASATFTGARHEIVLAAEASDAVERWLEELPEAELSVAGHLVADLKVVAMRQAGSDLTVTLAALTVEDR